MKAKENSKIYDVPSWDISNSKDNQTMKFGQ